ncbi:MAG: triphosphoribosyl-dephospho-CoA synthase MdcB [Luteitalea sp.]|nr:triphosphoribosyl-dephospho-CoA synthase MdcB [Luteitalea sp.]
MIGALAIRSLHTEVVLSPKPGLVSPSDAGSHADMDIRTFIRSLRSLRRYFVATAERGASGAPFRVLQQLGLRAESEMLAATDGVNTHRGGIFTLGLLAAAAGWVVARGSRPHGRLLGDVVTAQWGVVLSKKPLHARTNGSTVAAKYGAGGARREAVLGFPSVFDIGVPALQQALRAGFDVRRARIQALFSLMATLEDTNLLHRGGPNGLRLVQDRAHAFLARGGVSRPDWEQRTIAIHHELVRHNLSPGGSADLLAASCFVLALVAKLRLKPPSHAEPGAADLRY